MLTSLIKLIGGKTPIVPAPVVPDATAEVIDLLLVLLLRYYASCFHSYYYLYVSDNF